MRLPIVGADRGPGTDRYPEPRPAGVPLVVVFDVRGGERDRGLLELLRSSGWGGQTLWAVEGSPAESPLEDLGPGRRFRGRGADLVRTIAAHALGGPTLGVGAAVARAFEADRVLRVDGDLPIAAMTELARRVPAHLSLRDPMAGVIASFVRDHESFGPGWAPG